MNMTRGTEQEKHVSDERNGTGKVSAFRHTKTRRCFLGLWKKGDPLTEADQELLLPVLEAYRRPGRSPLKNEISNVSGLKGRFRTWANVLCAAGLPGMNDPEQIRKREREKRESGRDNL